jgi:hypothetical protein
MCVEQRKRKEFGRKFDYGRLAVYWRNVKWLCGRLLVLRQRTLRETLLVRFDWILHAFRKEEKARKIRNTENDIERAIT